MEKEPLLPRIEDHPKPQPRSRAHLTRYHALAFVIFIGLFWSSWPSSTCGLRRRPHRHHEEAAETKVPLEVHLMSKCPDARDCLQKFVVPSMANVSDKVDFKLSFIGKTTEDDGVQCMHGQTECLGNIVLLCAAASYPDPKISLGFTNCLVGDYSRIPDKHLIEDCALEHGMDFDTLNDCMSKDDGAYGMGMLRDSVTRSSDLGVSTSCTVRLDGKTRCVYDGGRSKDCEDGDKPEDLIHDIKKLYKKNSQA